jgi:hypothetical protein
LVDCDENIVGFRWHDYRHCNASRLMTPDAHEFIRRFLLHSLPDGFQRIRHYSVLCNGCRRTRIATIRRLLEAKATPASIDVESQSAPKRRQSLDPNVCPGCGGRLCITTTLRSWPTGFRRSDAP